MEQFFVGLVDSNVGSIQVNHWRKKSLQFRVIIKLNNTPANVEMLQYIQLRLKIGKISVRPNHVLLLAFLDLILTVQKRGLTTKMKFLKWYSSSRNTPCWLQMLERGTQCSYIASKTGTLYLMRASWSQEQATGYEGYCSRNSPPVLGLLWELACRVHYRWGLFLRKRKRKSLVLNFTELWLSYHGCDKIDVWHS